ncbi:TIGR03086 family metal-binding protein [Nocardia sp. NPDC049149]|uniref:TIGR03086 family metal-binding protein n=1 Tax=Nocardia sp. NPDC049149 TaxID=3364315 RepID=UPI0037208E62
MADTTVSPADRYRALSATFTGKVGAVPADRWDADSPCAGWTARDVVRHVIDTEREMVKVVGLELDPGPSVDDDPAAAWTAVCSSMQRILDDPALATREYDGHFGRTTLAATIDRFYCFDLVVHGWDLAAATETDTHIPEDELTWAVQVAHSLGDSLRMPGVCGPELDAPEGADEQTRMLAYLGRAN